MTEDFVTQLRLQLREAALREERRSPLALRVARARRGLPGPAPVAAALAVVTLALAIALGTLALRGEPEPAAPKVIGTYTVATGLSSLAPGFGSVWATDPNRGEILRVDLETRRVVARIPVGRDARVAAGSSAVWALAGDLEYAGDKGPVRLLRIDPDTNRVVARIPMRAPSGRNFGPLDVQVERDAVWVLGAGGALRVDPRRNAPDRFVPLAADATRGVVADGDRVWELTADGRLREIDARTGRAVADVPVRVGARSRLFPGRPGTLTVIDGDELALLDRASGFPLWRAALDGDVRFWIRGEDRAMWAYVARAPDARDELVRLDAGSGRRTAQVNLPEPGVAGMVTVGREVWVAAPGGKLVVVR